MSGLPHLTRDKRQVLFHYDHRGNLTLIRAGGESGVSEHHFQFSAGDKLCLASNTHRTVSYHYQANGLLREQTQGLHALAYRYHPHGQLSDIHLPSSETGLRYNLARYYDPCTGRFIQLDTDFMKNQAPLMITGIYCI
ncbi:RHS repeat domain-containing protein [Vibrio metschnikovii]|uniref:RHS repeat domain-containing protein n=1 Tax=Vibrio metschnikovii TaxID=28172 RepID=UPI0020C71FE0|nr:hypothetical protein [Vibrio metschnikovii]